MSTIEQHLHGLGFTELEAQIYRFLLTEQPSTAYRIAKGIAKPAANVYKGVDSLCAKGAALVETGKSRQYCAVPPSELIARIQQEFSESCERAAAALAQLDTRPEEEGVYELESRRQVLQRAREMLRRCQQIALIDAFPGPLELLKPEIADAVARGCTVAITAYSDFEVPGARVRVGANAAKQLATWRGQWLNVSVDGDEHLLAWLEATGDGVYRAVWSNSTYLSLLQFNGMASEFALHRLEAAIARGASIEEVQTVLAQERAELLSCTPPGLRRLQVDFPGGTS